MNILKKILNSIRLWFTITKTKSNAERTSSIIPGVEQDSLIGGTEQEEKWFQEKQSLAERFMGDAPIVYSSNLDSNVIRKQDQYGYIGDDATIVEEEGWEGLEFTKPTRKSNTASLVDPKAEFEERWNRIREENDIRGLGEDMVEIKPKTEENNGGD